MKRAVRFLLVTAAVAIVMGGLFLVIVCAPEPWQTRPWTLWEDCAKILFLVLGWPLWMAMLVLDRLPWRMPDWLFGTFFVTLFPMSGAFWVAAIEFARNRLKRTPNKGASPNGGPAMQSGNSGATEGPPSVS